MSLSAAVIQQRTRHVWVASASAAVLVSSCYAASAPTLSYGRASASTRLKIMRVPEADALQRANYNFFSIYPLVILAAHGKELRDVCRRDQSCTWKLEAL
jgi:hypothetical protein